MSEQLQTFACQLVSLHNRLLLLFSFVSNIRLFGHGMLSFPVVKLSLSVLRQHRSPNACFFRQQFVSSGQLLLFVSHGLSLSVTIIRSLLQYLTVFLKVPHSLSQLLTVFARKMLYFFVNSL